VGGVKHNLPEEIKNMFMIKKSQLKETLESLPEEFLLEDFMDQLILLDKIERADTQSENGEVISEDELEKEMQKWFK